MGRVGDLVGIDPDQARFDPDIAAIEVLGLPGGAFAAEGFAYQRAREIGEGAASAGLHFQQQGLALVDAHGDGLADRLVAPGRRQAALIHGVPGLMEDGHQALGEILFVIARGDAHIIGGSAGEGMAAFIESAMVEIEADGGHHSFAEGALGVEGEGAFEDKRRRLGRLALDDAGQEIGQEPGQAIKQPVDFGGAAMGLEAVEQGVIGIASKGLRLGPGGLAHQGEDLSHERCEAGEVVRRARLAPAHFRGRDRFGQGFDEPCIERVGVNPAPPHLGEIGALPGVQPGPLFGFRLLEQIAEGRVGEQFMADQGHRRRLLGAVAGAAGGHHGLAIPIENPCHTAQDAQSFEALFEGPIGAAVSHSQTANGV